ncbi:MAG: tRNA (5-methylaminomethyl-2-thiouridine)(34)-methyltransferase MnmD [Paracoccaceae bacterium]|nr:tRNA (5-methylaminomethyl-2-thiouridine)(34)-methyltransferase MnmD [Paracoccaceae bacterium]
MTGDQHQVAEIEWRDGVIPVARRFDDPYFSVQDGLAETRHVFLAGNDLPARFRPGFHIAELGFGTGLNMLAAWRAWLDSGQGGVLHFTSFEAYPMSADHMERALAAFPVLADLATEFLAVWKRGHRRFRLGGLEAEIVIGDARETLATWSGGADAWFLDGFSPARNPELWGPALMAQVATHTHPQGSFATYTAAGHVRRALSDAGFRVERVPGFGRKRHMTRGILEAR